MSIIITMNDNPKLLKIFKDIAKGFNEPITIKRKKDKIKDFYNSPEFLESIKEAEELKAAYLRGEVKAQKFTEFRTEMEKL